MSALSRIASLFRNLFRKSRVERDLDSELSSYLAQLTDEKIAAGMTPAEALRSARIELGGAEQVKEEVRDVRTGHLLEQLAQDLRYALRILRKSPGFSLVAIFTLAVGIGANTAIFSVVHAVLLESLPYPHADRLTIVWSTFGKETRAPASGPELIYLRERSQLFEEFAGIWVNNATLTGEKEPEQIKVGFVTSNFLSLLASRPAWGRLFEPKDQGFGAALVVILSDGLWRRRYGADPQIVGRVVRINGRPTTVVGILPPDFRVVFPEGASVPPDLHAFIPFAFDLARGPRDMCYIRIVGRLRPGATIPQAQTEAEKIAAQLNSEFTEFGSQNFNLRVVPLHGDVVRNVRPALLALFAGVGLVLLIACANVANLLLARATERKREITLRTALGAPPSRIIRQLLTESVLLSILGGAAALWIGWWALHVFVSFLPEGISRVREIQLNLPVLGFTLAVAVFSGILFGLAPALSAARVNLSDALKEGGRTSTGGKQRSRTVLVISEVALGFVLLIGAGLMAQTFLRLLRLNPGFDSRNVLTFQLALAGPKYSQDKLRSQFVRDLEAKLSALPGVESVGMASHLPFDDGLPNWYSYYWPEGASEQDQNTTMADHRSVQPGYFRTLGVPFLEGRNFDAFDNESGRFVTIIDETVARHTWPGQSALGKKLSVQFILNGSFVNHPAEVIGVVSHVHSHSLTTRLRGQVYVPYPLASRAQISFTVRASTPPDALVAAVRREVAALDKDLPPSRFRAMDEYVAKAQMETRFTSILASLMAGIALLLACVGVYSVTSCAVGQRTGEIGLRMAMGAQRRDVLRMLLRESMLPVVLGSLFGLALSLLLTPMYSNLLFGVRPLDPATYAAVFLFLFTAGLLASYMPARRALRIDPMVALRYE